MAEANVSNDPEGNDASSIGLCEHSESRSGPNTKQAGVTSVWTIASSVSNLVVSEDSVGLFDTGAPEREQDECPPKKQRISVESPPVSLDAASFTDTSAISLNASNREDLETGIHEWVQCSPGSEEDVLRESVRSRQKTRKTLAARNCQSQRFRVEQGLESKSAQAMKVSECSAVGVDITSSDISAGLPLGVGMAESRHQFVPVPGTSRQLLGSENEPIQTTGTVSTADTFGHTSYSLDPSASPSTSSETTDHQEGRDTMASVTSHSIGKSSYSSYHPANPKTSISPPRASDRTSCQLSRGGKGKEQGVRKYLKRSRSYPEGSGSTSQSSEFEDIASDNSLVFSSLSSSSSHDYSFHGNSRDAPIYQEKGPTTISDLPTFILIQIFSWLPLETQLGAVNRVCKAWQSAVLDPSLWRDLDLSGFPRLTNSALLQVTSYSDRVHTLVMTDFRSPSTLLTNDGMAKALQQCSHLREVNVSQSHFLMNQSFGALGKYCHKLRHINLGGCFCLSDVSLEAIGAGCPELEELDIGQCSHVSDKGLCAVARGCPRLNKLRLDHCLKITDKGVIALTDHCPDLEYLHLLSCKLTDVAISQLSKLLNLYTLDVSNIPHMSPRVLETVAVSCPKLECLSLSLNPAVDDQCLGTLAQCCPQLKKLTCVACTLTDTGLEYVGKYARNLESLDVAWCLDITEAGITAVAAGCPNLNYLGFLRCNRVNMHVVEELLYKYPNVRFSNFFLESRRLFALARRQGNSLFR